jgi:titin
MVIDGSTQPGFANQPVIVVDASQIIPETFTSDTVLVYSSSNQLRNIAFTGFDWNGVTLLYPDATNNTISGCWFGVAFTGTNAAPNAYQGILIAAGASGNIIGGTNALQRNVISGNSQYGVFITDTNTVGNVVLGNDIGTDASGANALANGLSGIFVGNGSSGTVIGGTNAGARNILSGNSQYGVILTSNTTGNVVLGNFIGTDFSGSNSIPNGFVVSNSYAGIGIFAGASGNLIGGTNAAARNIISGNTNVGVYLAGPGVSNNVIEGNYIGLNFAGTSALPSQGFGIYLIGGVSGNTVGGTTPGARNVISGNHSYGLYISDPSTSNNFVFGNFIGPDATGTNAMGDGGIGVGILNSASGNFIGGVGAGTGNLISGSPGFSYGIATYGANNNTIQGNYVGTDLTGKNAFPNGFTGIALMFGSSGNLVGGAVPGAGNLISANGSYGVYIYAAGTTNNLVEGNIIGADITATNALGNGTANVALLGGATGNFIGGTSAGAGNVIAFAGNPGVALYDASTKNNSIRGNSIFSNGGKGIDLTGVGNDLQSSPVITNAFGTGTNTVVQGKLSSTANTGFFIDVYRNIVAGGQGQFYLGTVGVNTDGSGNASFAYTNTSDNYSGQAITATATAANGDSSEFSAAVTAGNVATPSAQFGTAMSWQNSGFVFNLTFITNFSYHVQATTNLSGSPIPWVNLTNFTAITSSLTFTDRAAAGFHTRFYRVTSP